MTHELRKLIPFGKQLEEEKKMHFLKLFEFILTGLIKCNKIRKLSLSFSTYSKYHSWNSISYQISLPRLRLDSIEKHRAFVSLFAFFLEAHLCGFYVFSVSPVYYLWDL